MKGITVSWIYLNLTDTVVCSILGGIDQAQFWFANTIFTEFSWLVCYIYSSAELCCWQYPSAKKLITSSNELTWGKNDASNPTMVSYNVAFHGEHNSISLPWWYLKRLIHRICLSIKMTFDRPNSCGSCILEKLQTSRELIRDRHTICSLQEDRILHWNATGKELFLKWT